MDRASCLEQHVEPPVLHSSEPIVGREGISLTQAIKGSWRLNTREEERETSAGKKETPAQGFAFQCRVWAAYGIRKPR